MKAKTVFVCNECDYQSAKWLGRCPSCKAWNTFEEQVIEAEIPAKAAARRTVYEPEEGDEARLIGELAIPEYMRCQSGMNELDRVLGGGIVSGSVVLLSGEPGIGKSTLLMQVSDSLSSSRCVLYVSGEESRGQLKLRAKRLGIRGERMFLLTSANVDAVLHEADRLNPEVIIADSIQTMYSDRISSSPGSVSQIKETAARLINYAKGRGVSVILVGHVNKEGSIAGPKVLEHMVDAVLCFEGEQQHAYRVIRATKNRYGSTNEIGVFEMTGEGLAEVPNPSEMLLEGRPKNVSGNCAVCVMEGTRPIIAEIQALSTPTAFPSPRRTSNGLDYNRVFLIIAVLEKRLGLRFSTQDIYLNVVGGLKLDEPAADLASALALISSVRDIPLPDDLIAIGELGLAGECRAVTDIDQRISEAARLGFRKILIPYKNHEKKPRVVPADVELCPIRSIYETLAFLKKAGDKAKKE